MANFECGAWAQELLSRTAPQPAPLTTAGASEKIDDTVPARREFDPVGPGWYESSWDLLNGLTVHEGMPIDVKLHEWLAAELVGVSKKLELCEALA